MANFLILQVVFLFNSELIENNRVLEFVRQVGLITVLI